VQRLTCVIVSIGDSNFVIGFHFHALHLRDSWPVCSRIVQVLHGVHASLSHKTHIRVLDSGTNDGVTAD